MTEVQTTDADVATETAQEAPQGNPNRVWFRNDYSRAITFLRTARQARYGAPWDAKDNAEAGPRIDALAGTMAGAFLADNPFFDADTFLAATQLPEAPAEPEGDGEPADVDELAAMLDDAEGDEE
jgi:hypothetical protein